MKTFIFCHETGTAGEIVRGGGVAAVPTETVYGLCVNGLDTKAVERLYTAKGRPETKPISLFVTGMDGAEKLCRDIPESAYVLAGKFWPGPLTMIFKRRDIVPDVITAGGDTVGVRCPDDELVLSLLRETGIPLTGTSANVSGQPDAVDAARVLEYFDGRIDCVIDGGVCRGGVPSTIVDMTREPPRILREGGISRDSLENALGVVIL